MGQFFFNPYWMLRSGQGQNMSTGMARGRAWASGRAWARGRAANMNKHLRNIGLCAMGLIIALPAFATTESTKATVTFLTPINITKGTPLHFGVLTVPAGVMSSSITKSVRLRPDGTVITLSSSIVNPSGTPTPARYTVTGSANEQIAFSAILGTNPTNGTSTLQLTDFTFNTDSPVNLDANGQLAVSMGATLTIPELSTRGDYTGTVIFTANYN
ncbi:DUF4402 domain-containing protein [Sneathiella marina]|uniref:DUF4402 domain-containing protein n=1 Tax=Sneathiella marina TaxID=2950108 RepID=UPI003B848D84